MTKAPSIRKMGLSYLALKKRFLKSRKNIELIKLIFVSLFFLFSIVFYWYFVNVSSTKWYFLKQEREKLSEIKFQNEIVKIDVRRLESSVLNNIVVSNSSTLTWRVISITDLNSVAYR